MNGSKTQELARQALGQLADELEAGHSERLKAYLAAMGRFRAYSPTNVLLICMQFPQASRVAGYRTWQRLGRQVRRGAKAIRILADPAEGQVRRQRGHRTSGCVQGRLRIRRQPD